MNLWEKAILSLTAALTAALLIRMTRLGLIKIYRSFFWYLAADLASTLCGLFISSHTNLYALVYVAIQTLKIVIAAFTVAELCRLALEGQPALARFGRAAAAYGLALAGAIPVILIAVEHAGPDRFPVLRAFFSFEQTMNATMVCFLTLTVFFVIWFPVWLPRNTLLVIFGFAAWSLSRWLYVYCSSHWFGSPLNTTAEAGQMAVVVGCLLCWLAGMRREGERPAVFAGHRADADRLSMQLTAINDHLERLAHGFSR